MWATVFSVFCLFVLGGSAFFFLFWLLLISLSYYFIDLVKQV